MIKKGKSPSKKDSQLHLFFSGFAVLFILLILLFLVPFYSSKIALGDDIFAIPVPDLRANICFLLGHLSRLCSIMAVITLFIRTVFETISKREHFIHNWKWVFSRWILVLVLGIMVLLIYSSTNTLLAGAYVSGSPDSLFIIIPSF